MKCLNEDLQRRLLCEAYRTVKANGGPAGIDEMTFKKIGSNGVNEFIEGIKKELNNGPYQLSLFKKVSIAEPDGKLCKMEVPTIKDRIVHMYFKISADPASSLPATLWKELREHNERGPRWALNAL